MSETLVVIRTFESIIEADEAQIDLMNAGIQSLVLSDDRSSYMAASQEAVALAVHCRDADVACAVLVPQVAPER